MCEVASATAAALNFDIPSQPLANALVEFSRQSDVSVSVPSELVRGKQSPEIKGPMDPREALEKLLAGSGLQISASREGVLAIERKVEMPASVPAKSLALRARSPAENSEISEPHVDEIVVTGSRIIREGYRTPTPLIVVGIEQIRQTATPNIVNYLNDLPALSGTQMTSNNHVGTTSGSAGSQNLNLRSLGTNRVLVLLDGQRTVGVNYSGVPDIGSFPQQLIARVDVVTGGASAVYGSDAVAGVINFILDKKFTGVKGEISGGLTAYGDEKNYKASLSAGFDFDDDRGHALISGQQLFNAGINGAGGRAWDFTGFMQITNPAYSPGNGQPALLVTPQAALASSTPGGIIISGPLKGTAFGANGAPFKFNYGSLYLSPYMVGGDWQYTDLRNFYDVDARQSAQSLFTRVSYDVTDNVTAFVQYNWSQNHVRGAVNRYWILDGAMSLKINADNAYLPASVRAAMLANNITSFQLGTSNADLGTFGSDNTWLTNRFNVGFEGALDAFDTTWHWNFYYAYGSTKQQAHSPPGLVLSLYAEATDAVVSPTTGQIVCRSALTNPTNGCRPWNVMGVNVNTPIAHSTPWFFRPDFQFGLIQQQTYAASISGEPFSLWAGPVSVAIGFEQRIDQIRSEVDQYSLAFDRPVGNFSPLKGRQSVSEGSIEALIPLTKDTAWAHAWDLNLAARFTGYELSGYVTTWKVGTTFAPVDDIKFRLTRSLDIRAPNLQELFAAPNAVGAYTVIDPFLKNAQYAIDHGFLTANPNLSPERADTTGIGIIVSPRFAKGFTASVDFWSVDINGAILPLTAQQVMDSCYDGQRPQLCANIVRNPQTGLVSSISYSPINLATQDMKGIDIDTSYSAAAATLMKGLPGNVSLHGLMTFYLRNYQNNTFNAPSNHVGENGGAPTSGGNPPHWKLSVTASYALDPVTFALTARAFSSGVINSEYVQCSSACPASTPDHLTVNYNYTPGAFYLDANVIYKLDLGASAAGELFLSVKNLFNRDPGQTPASFLQSVSANSALYDQFGALYRAGIRFSL